MLKKPLIVAISLATLLCVVGCSDGSGQATATPDSTIAIDDPITPSEEGKVGDYYVKILDGELAKTYEDKDCVLVYFEFTNNSDKDANFMTSVSAKGFQENVEVETALVTNSVDEHQKTLSDVKPGGSVTVAYYYKYVSGSPLLIEVGPLFSFTNDPAPVAKTFTF